MVNANLVHRVHILDQVNVLIVQHHANPVPIKHSASHATIFTICNKTNVQQPAQLIKFQMALNVQFV